MAARDSNSPSPATEVTILRELLASDSGYVSGNHLAKQLGLSRVAIWMQLQKLTKQGFELQFGVNHLGCFALTALLLPKLAESAGRVVITASLAHRRGRIDWDDVEAAKGYRRFPRYRMSKLANALFLFELDRRLRAAGSPVTAVGCAIHTERLLAAIGGAA